MVSKKELAELVGILLGDGSLSLKENNPRTNNRLKISFNSRDDREYIYYVEKMIETLFDEKPKIKFRKNENTADLFIFKKKIIDYLSKDVGLKLSPKWNTAVIPTEFMQYPFSLDVLRGYFDTDGCLVTTNNNGTIYPRLEMKICPSPMQSQFIDILNENEFKFGVYPIGNGKVRVQLNGKGQLKRWIDLVGFSNSKHTMKIKRFQNL